MTKPTGVAWAERFLDDLKERQVNTIIADGISGRAMTHPVRGLCDVANTYFRKLRDGGFVDSSKIAADILDGNRWLKGDHKAFELLEQCASEALHQAVSDGDRIIYQRIVSTASQLKSIAYGILTRHPGIDWSGARASDETLPEISLPPEERAAIAKAWELGTAVVAIQTTIGLDGDLVTRIGREHVGPSSAVLRQIHDESVRTSIGTWESLVKGILQLARAAIG
jgi:hypothetical protein